MPTLYDLLLRHPAFRSAIGFLPFRYWVKSDRSAADIKELMEPFVPGFFTIFEFDPEGESGGRIPKAAGAWLHEPTPPSRIEGHEPSELDVARLPALDIVEADAQQAKIERMILAEPLGVA
jgi:hypothetical protein